MIQRVLTEKDARNLKIILKNRVTIDKCKISEQLLEILSL